MAVHIYGYGVCIKMNTSGYNNSELINAMMLIFLT